MNELLAEINLTCYQLPGGFYWSIFRDESIVFKTNYLLAKQIIGIIYIT